MDQKFQTGITWLIIIALGIAGKKVIDLLVEKIFKKQEKYVTIQQCEKQRTEILIQTDSKITMSRDETHRILETMNKTMEQQNVHLDTLNKSVIVGILNNSSLTEDEKQKSVIELSSRNKNK